MLRVQPTLTALTPVSRWLHLRILRAFDTLFWDFVFNWVEAASWPKVAPQPPIPRSHTPLSGPGPAPDSLPPLPRHLQPTFSPRGPDALSQGWGSEAQSKARTGPFLLRGNGHILCDTGFKCTAQRFGQALPQPAWGLEAKMLMEQPRGLAFPASLRQEPARPRGPWGQAPHRPRLSPTPTLFSRARLQATRAAQCPSCPLTFLPDSPDPPRATVHPPQGS